jgi:hypothetical protein
MVKSCWEEEEDDIMTHEALEPLDGAERARTA